MTVILNEEMNSAINELNQVEMMFANAETKLRIDEASFRIQAAQKRIDAILYESKEKLWNEAIMKAIRKQNITPRIEQMMKEDIQKVDQKRMDAILKGFRA